MKRHRLRHVALALLLFAAYMLSYYGWVRRWERTFNGFSLHYDRIPLRQVRSLLDLIHAPLQSLDQSQYTMIVFIDDRSPELLVEIPEFDDPPDFILDK